MSALTGSRSDISAEMLAFEQPLRRLEHQLVDHRTPEAAPLGRGGQRRARVRAEGGTECTSTIRPSAAARQLPIRPRRARWRFRHSRPPGRALDAAVFAAGSAPVAFCRLVLLVAAGFAFVRRVACGGFRLGRRLWPRGGGLTAGLLAVQRGQVGRQVASGDLVLARPPAGSRRSTSSRPGRRRSSRSCSGACRRSGAPRGSTGLKGCGLDRDARQGGDRFGDRRRPAGRRGRPA